MKNSTKVVIGLGVVALAAYLYLKNKKTVTASLTPMMPANNPASTTTTTTASSGSYGTPVTAQVAAQNTPYIPAPPSPSSFAPSTPQQTTVTYTAPSGSSITINYTDWDGNRQQLFILNGSQTIDCLQGSDSIISTTPYDFSNSPATLYPVPVMGATINSTYNLPSSLSQVCPIGQPMTQDCMNAILQLNQYHSDLISQRTIKKAQDNGSSLNSITTQVNGGASLSVITDPNKAAIINKLYNNPNPNLTSDNTTQGVTTQNCHEDPNTGLWVCS
jgi:hypothetical protein